MEEPTYRVIQKLEILENMLEKFWIQMFLPLKIVLMALSSFLL